MRATRIWAAIALALLVARGTTLAQDELTENLQIHGPKTIEPKEVTRFYVSGMPQPDAEACQPDLKEHFAQLYVLVCHPDEHEAAGRAKFYMTTEGWEPEIEVMVHGQGAYDLVVGWLGDKPMGTWYRFHAGPEPEPEPDPDPTPDPDPDPDPVDPPSELAAIIWGHSQDKSAESIQALADAYRQTAEEVAAQRNPILPEGVPELGRPGDVLARLDTNLKAALGGDLGAWQVCLEEISAFLTAREYTSIYQMQEGMEEVAEAGDWCAKQRAAPVSWTPTASVPEPAIL